jgi:hypothetical protein
MAATWLHIVGARQWRGLRVVGDVEVALGVVRGILLWFASDKRRGSESAPARRMAMTDKRSGLGVSSGWANGGRIKRAEDIGSPGGHLVRMRFSIYMQSEESGRRGATSMSG